MTATTWKWNGGSGLSTVPLNWTRISGPGNVLSDPAAGDVVFVPAGDILDGLPGMSGQGTVTVEAGATISPTFGGISLGPSSGTTGTMTVTGAGAELILGALSSGIVLGNAGTGALLVQNDGKVVDTAMVLGGSASAPNGGIGTLAATGGGEAEITGGLTLWDGSTVSVDATSGIDLGTGNSFVTGALVVTAGDPLIGSGTIAAAVVNNGTISVQNNANLNASTGGSVEVTGAISGTGVFSIQAGATLQIDGAIAATETIRFVRGGIGRVIFAAPAPVIAAPIIGFNEGDMIVLLPGGITLTDAEVVNSSTLAVNYQNANGTSGAYDFTNFASGGSNQGFATGGDPFTNGVFVLATTFFNWATLGGGRYDDATNWSQGISVPDVTDSAAFDFGSGGTITGPGTAAIMSFSNTANWTVASGSSLFAAISLQVGIAGGGPNGIGTVNVGSGATLESGGTIGVGIFPGAIAGLNITGGGLVHDSLAAHPWAGMNIGEAPGTGTLSASVGTVSVTGAGSFLNVGLNPLDLASDGGTGSLVVAQGGSVEAASVDSSLIDALGIGGLGNGTVTVTDPGSRLTSTGVAMVAQAGISALNIQNSGVFQAVADQTGLAGVDIGAGGTAGVGGLGVVTVTTSGVLNSSGYVNVGERGVTGQLWVLNGGTVEAGTSVTVGAGGTIDSGQTEIGNGTLAIGAGGTVEFTGTPQTASEGVYLGYSNIGTASAENALATVSGIGALLNAGARGIAVGQYGTAGLTVSLGGTVISGSTNSSLVPALTIGRDGIGTLTVTGAGSKLTASGASSTGQAGSGNLIVQNQGSVVVGLDSLGVGGLTIGGGAVNNGTLYAGGGGNALVEGGGDLFSQATIGVGENGTPGLLTVLSGGTVDASTQLLIGASTVLAPGATIISPSGTTGVSSNTTESATGVVIVGAGGLLEAGGNGIASAGTAAVVVGAGIGSVGTMDVSGAGATLNGNGQGLDVGLLGQGAVTVDQGGTLLAGTQFTSDPAISIGVGAAISGALTVADPGSLVRATGQINVGGAGKGTLTIQNQSTVQSGGSTLAPSQGIDVGRSAGGTGRIQVTGTQSLLTNTGGFVVGDGGLGSLDIDSGGTVITNSGTVPGLAALVIANTPGAAGSNITVSGAGSELVVNGLLDVGAGGSGGFQLSGGAIVTIAALDAGNIPSAVGQLSLTDAGTQLTVTGAATVADDGTGVLSVLNGATFNAASLTIGSQGNSSGALVVSGTGSAVNFSGALNIGTALGIGDLTVGPGAVVHASVVNLQGQVVLEGGLLDPTVQLINQGQTVGGFGTIAAGDIVDEGVIQAGGNKASQKLLLVQGNLLGGGTLTVDGSQPGSNEAGILQINAGGTMELTGAVLNAATTTFTDNLTPTGTYTVNNSVVDVTFADAAGVLKLDDIAGFAGTITTFHAGDSFVISGGTLSNPNVVNGNTLTFADSGANAGTGGIDSIIFASPVSAAGFNVVNNTVQVACFAAGTLIETQDRAVAVEDLTVGDEVRTLLGGPGQIVWIGSRAVDCARHPRPETVWPVRIARGALGENLPARDLFVSPDHAIYLDGVLIPAKYLLNGSTVRQMKRRRVVYYHVELARHDVVLAEGLPAESYLDTGDRANFSGGGVLSLHPDFAARTWEMEGCAQLVVTGRKLDAVRQRIDALAGRTRRDTAIA